MDMKFYINYNKKELVINNLSTIHNVVGSTLPPKKFAVAADPM